MSKLNESNKPAVHNILFNAGYNPTSVERYEFKRTVETQNYYVTLNADEWFYNKPQPGNADDICAFGDYSPEGLDKLRRIVTIDPNESE